MPIFKIANAISNDNCYFDCNNLLYFYFLGYEFMQKKGVGEMKGSRIVWLSLILGSVVLLGSAFMMNVMHEQAHKVIYEEAGIKANIQYGLFSGITTADTNNVPDWVVAQQMQTESFGYQQQAATLSIMLMMLCCTILLILTKV